MSMHDTPRNTTEKSREVRELSLLLEISRALQKSMDIQDVVGPVLHALADHMGMTRGTISLLNRETGEIVIEAAHGLTEKQLKRGRYKFGEGVTGKVIQTGKPAVVEKIGEDPTFLDRTGARGHLSREDISFLCVPIKLENDVIGALSCDRLFDENTSFQEDIRLLTIIASVIANAVRLRRSAMEERQRLMNDNLRYQRELKQKFHPSNIIGNSSAMQEVYDLVAQVSDSDTTVMIRGESGVGKELVAHAIHYNSPRADKPFIKVNCAALPESILESELFGHEKGAFTGAVSKRAGRFESAAGGTIFLDELGDFSASTQIKLLRVLQEREFERVGGSTPVKMTARIITATNRDLEKMVETGAFRQDLYYRLNVFPIFIPPLRRRPTDILQLADHFVEKYAKRATRNVRRISTPAIDMLTAYHWPGNVRELENCIERAVLLSQDGVIHGHHLPPTLQTAEGSRTRFKGRLPETLANVEQELIVEALKVTRGNMAQAARDLGITERQMGVRVKKYGIDIRRFKRHG